MREMDIFDIKMRSELVSTRRSIVLSLPLQQGFPGRSLGAFLDTYGEVFSLLTRGFPEVWCRHRDGATLLARKPLDRNPFDRRTLDRHNCNLVLSTVDEVMGVMDASTKCCFGQMFFDQMTWLPS
jgi:hypothetical protein